MGEKRIKDFLRLSFDLSKDNHREDKQRAINFKSTCKEITIYIFDVFFESVWNEII